MPSKELPDVLSLSLGSLTWDACNLLCTEAEKRSAGVVSMRDCNAYLTTTRQVCMFNGPRQAERLNTQLMKLGMRGVTVVAASGDGGSHFSFQPFSGGWTDVVDDDVDDDVGGAVRQSVRVRVESRARRVAAHAKGRGAQGAADAAAAANAAGDIAGLLNSISCQYQMPTFPSVSPYVTSVGGSQWFLKDVGGDGGIEAEHWPAGGAGFSLRFKQPAYQASAVEDYLSAAGGATPSRLPPAASFNQKGRAYPDLVMWANNVPIVLHGVKAPSGGTSAAAPVFGGMISLLNDVRRGKGLKQLGFLNPRLYAAFDKHGDDMFRDIVDGDTNANSGATPCKTGFQGVKGWDAVRRLVFFFFFNVYFLFVSCVCEIYYSFPTLFAIHLARLLLPAMSCAQTRL
jgi:hypothetical protein